MTYEEIMRRTDELTGQIKRLELEAQSLSDERKLLYQLAEIINERDYQEKQNGMV